MSTYKKLTLGHLFICLIAYFAFLTPAHSKKPCIDCGKIEHTELEGVGDRACNCTCGWPRLPNDIWTSDPNTCQDLNGTICYDGSPYPGHPVVHWHCNANAMITTVAQACQVARGATNRNIWRKECPNPKCTYWENEYELPGYCEKDKFTMFPAIRTAITCSVSAEISCACEP